MINCLEFFSHSPGCLNLMSFQQRYFCIEVEETKVEKDQIMGSKLTVVYSKLLLPPQIMFMSCRVDILSHLNMTSPSLTIILDI